MAEIRYRFVSSGSDSILAAFSTVDKAAQRSAKAVGASYAAAERGAVRSASASGTARARAEDRWGMAAEKSAERALKATQRTEERRWKEVERTGQKIQRELEREARQAERLAGQRARAEERAQERVAESRRRIIGRAGERIGTGASMLAFGAGAAAVGLVGAAARQDLKLSEVANRFAINARLGGAGEVSPADVKRSFENTAIATPGISAESVGQAALAFQSKTGMTLNQEQLQTLATTASASGAEITDLSTALATLTQKFDIKTVDQMKDSFAALLEQGAKGAFELKDMAATVEEMGAAAQRFGIGKGPQAVRVFGGIAQMARTSTGSGDEAKTAVEHLFSGLITHAESLRSGKLGGKAVRVFDKKGQARDIQDVLVETVANVGGRDLEAKRAGLQTVFGERGIRAVSPLLEAFVSATKDGRDAMQAMRDVLKQNIETGATWDSVQKAASQAQSDASAKVIGSWEQFKQTVGEKVVPAMLPLVEKLPMLAEAAVPVIEIFGDVVDAVVKFIESLPGTEDNPAVKRSKARKALGSLDQEIASQGVGTPTLEQLNRRGALLATIEGKSSTPESKVGTQVATEGAIIGAAAGGALGGAPGAAVGGALGAGVGAASAEQGRQRADLHDMGFIETPSGGLIPVGPGKQQSQQQNASGPLKDFVDALMKAMRAAETQADAAQRAANALDSIKGPAEVTI